MFATDRKTHNYEGESAKRNQAQQCANCEPWQEHGRITEIRGLLPMINLNRLPTRQLELSHRPAFWQSLWSGCSSAEQANTSGRPMPGVIWASHYFAKNHEDCGSCRIRKYVPRLCRDCSHKSLPFNLQLPV